MARSKPLKRLREHRFGTGRRQVRAYEVTHIRPELSEAPDLPTFALVHGLGVSSRYFVPLAELLAPHGRVVVFDLPGFGGIPHPDDPLAIEDFALTVRVALRRLDVHRPVLLGHSMGAQVVVEVAVQEEELGGALLLVSPVVNAHERTVRLAARRFVQSARHERLGSALVSLRAYLWAGLRWPLEVLPAMLHYPIEERVGLLGGSLAILAGDLDLLCPPEWVDELAAAATRARVTTVEIPGAAHQVVIDHAREVAQAALGVAGIGAVLP